MKTKKVFSLAVVAVLGALGTWVVLDFKGNESNIVNPKFGSMQSNETENMPIAREESKDDSTSTTLDDWYLDENDPEDFLSVSTATTYLNYPESPFQVYERYIEKAKGGDAASMYRVSKAFLECSKAPRSQEHFDKFYLGNAALEPYWAQFENAMKRCQSFTELFGEDVVLALESKYWRDRAAEAGYLTAGAERLMDEIDGNIERNSKNDELRKLLDEAVQIEGYGAYYQMAHYLERLEFDNDQFSDSRHFGDRPNIAAAWRYAGCKLQEGCNQQKFISQMKRSWHAYETDEFLEHVRKIENSIVVDL